MINRRRILLSKLLIAICLTAFVPTLSAQVQVDLHFNRTLYLRYEPIIATVTIANRSGRVLELTDDGEHKWFGFQIESSDGRLLPPNHIDYRLNPITLGVGETIKRSINLTPLYPITDFGVYRIRAAVYDSEVKQYFGSAPPLNIEITDGRLLWQQTVGVPGSDETRTISLLSHRLPRTSHLYLRIENKDRGVVFCTHQLGRYVSFGEPMIELDALNQVHVLQNTAPKEYMYSHIGLNGEVLARDRIDAPKNRPSLGRDPSGNIQIVGGTVIVPPDPSAPQSPTERPPSVSDRPAPMPDL